MTNAEYEQTKNALKKRVAAIDALFPNRVDCTDYLYTYIPGGLRCKKCGCPDVTMVTDDHRVAVCNACHKQFRPTAGTFFHGARKLRDWVRVLRLLEEGITFSANLYATIAGLSTSSVEMMMMKIRFTILSTIDDEKTALSAELMPAVCKRSVQTESGEHPVSEQDEFEQKQKKSIGWDGVQSLISQAVNKRYIGLIEDRPSEYPILDVCDNELEIYKLLTFKPIAHEDLLDKTALTLSETLASLVNLQLINLVEDRVNTWFSIKRCALPILAKDPESPTYDLDSFVRFVRDVFHGVSRKYLQLYYADYACQRTVGATNMVRLVMSRKKVSWRQIRHYVSPPVVKIVE